MSARTAVDPVALIAVEDPELLLDAVTVTDADGRIVAVNRAFTRLHGYTAHEVIGRRPDVVSSGLQSATFTAELWRTILTGQPWEGELINRHADGTLRTVRSRIVPVREPGGNISHFVAIQRQVVGDGPVPAGQIRVDVRGRCTYADPRAAVLLRRDGDPVALLGPGLLTSLIIEDAAALREVIEQAARTGRSHVVDLAGADGYLRCTVEPDPSSYGLTAGQVVQVTCEPFAGLR